jgi:hypothetical protein
MDQTIINPLTEIDFAPGVSSDVADITYTLRGRRWMDSLLNHPILSAQDASD